MQDLISNLSVAAAYAPIALLILIGKVAKHIYEFHDEFLAKRRFKRLGYLREEAAGNAELIDFVEQAKHELVFAGTLGRSASPRLARAILELYRTNFLTISDLKFIHFHIQISEEGQVQVRPGKLGIAIAVVSIAVTIGIAIYFAPLIVALAALKTLESTAAALILLLGASAMSLSMLREVLEVAIAFRVRRQLQKYRAAGFDVSLPDLPTKIR